MVKNIPKSGQRIRDEKDLSGKEQGKMQTIKHSENEQPGVNGVAQQVKRPSGMGTPIRGQSGSARRNIVAQQSMQQIKK